MRIQESIRMLFSQQFSAARLSHLYNCRRHGLLVSQRLKPQVPGITFLRGFVNCDYYIENRLEDNGIEERRHGDNDIQESRHRDNVLPPVAKKLKRLNIHPKSYKLLGQDQNILCPKCDGGSSKEISLSLLFDLDGNNAVWVCHRAKCGWKGCTQETVYSVHPSPKLLIEENLQVEQVSAKETVYSVHPSPKLLIEKNLQLEQVSAEISTFFGEQKISPETLQRNKVMQTRRDNKTVIAFTYRENGKIVNCRYYDAKMQFWEESENIVPYGLDDISDAGVIIIVQAEFDKLSVEEAGYKNCISVPSTQKDRKFKYISDFKKCFDQASRIVLATNADEEGQALAEEIARRIGREKCWRAKWPTVRLMSRNDENNEDKSCNDANMELRKCNNASDVLLRLGPEHLKMEIDNAEPYPIKGLYKFGHYFHLIDDYYQCRLGDEFGVSTGWTGLDELYRVVPGELTIVTGVPNSGKSEWIDALLCNLNHRNDWRFALCSMENKVEEHGRKLIEKHVRKPFFCAKYGDNLPRISPEELEAGKQWLDEAFCLIRSEDDSLPSMNWVLRQAKAAVLRYGIQGLVIDPYNELDHQRPSNQTETEYVSQMLTMVKRFSQHHRCHVWFVAHPRQLQNWNGDPPGIYDISGSAHFINKCDNAIVIHRNRDPDALDQVQVIVKKVRNKVAGNIGEACLSYNRVTGEFSDVMA